MKTKILTSLFLCALLFTGCGNKQSNSNYPADSGVLSKKVGDTIVIRLESNPTTGYSWSLAEIPSDIIQKVSNIYEPLKTSGNIVGSGGTEIWTFKAISKGNTTLTFQYARPWEKDVPPIKTETYQITVK